MEDLDPPREEPGAAQSILQSLRSHGLHPDTQVMFQSNRLAAYDAALASLRAGQHLFSCDCSRAMLGPEGACNGRCAGRQSQLADPASQRVRVPREHQVKFVDQLQGPQDISLGIDTPDFVVKRKDNLYAYQLAVVTDDAAQDITHIVRGSDLSDSTARQIFLQQVLAHPTPNYLHLPVITTDDGQKFSKQSHAPALHDADACVNLRHSLAFLEQEPPPEGLSTPAEILSFSIERWRAQRIPAKEALRASDLGLPG
ncbi:MAG: glutamyl-Q tRNA(Asp) synthetase [Halioglobus sp.]|jgi:glutamyl-Q tRNA(Asp) synthetase